MDVYEELIRERDAGRSTVLATIVNAIGSVPSYGDRKAVAARGRNDRRHGWRRRRGSRGDQESAKEVLATGKPKLASFDLHENPRMDIGMVCGGSLNVFIEAIRPAPLRICLAPATSGRLLLSRRSSRASTS